MLDYNALGRLDYETGGGLHYRLSSLGDEAMPCELIGAQHCKKPGETRRVSIRVSDLLDDDEKLTGTPTAAEVDTSDLTITNVVVSSAAVTINHVSVPAGEAIQFMISGGTEYTDYQILITATTDTTPAQTIVFRILLRVGKDS